MNNKEILDKAIAELRLYFFQKDILTEQIDKEINKIFKISSNIQVLKNKTLLNK